MERYLLFDSGCTLCTGLAQDIERETNGWLTTRSLREPAMKELLDKTRPDWKWEPTLVEIDNAHVRVLTGVKMRSYLVVGLGPKRAVRVAQLVQQALAPKDRYNSERRKFLKAASVVGLALFGFSGTRALSPTSALAAPHDAEVVVVSGAEVEPLLNKVGEKQYIKLLTKYLYSSGFRLSKSHSVGFLHDDGSKVVMLMFAATNGGNDFGQITYVQTSTGEERANGTLVRYLQDMDKVEAGLKYVKTAQDLAPYIEATNIVVDNGRITRSGSPTATSSLLVGTDAVTIQQTPKDCFWNCWFDRMTFCCSPAAGGCLLSGLGYVLCLTVVCSSCVVRADTYCSISCNYPMIG